MRILLGLFKKPDPNAPLKKPSILKSTWHGMERGGQVGSWTGSALGSVAGAPLGVPGALVGKVAGHYAGELAGAAAGAGVGLAKGVHDKLKYRKAKKQQPVTQPLKTGTIPPKDVVGARPVKSSIDWQNFGRKQLNKNFYTNQYRNFHVAFDPKKNIYGVYKLEPISGAKRVVSTFRTKASAVAERDRLNKWSVRAGVVGDIARLAPAVGLGVAGTLAYHRAKNQKKMAHAQGVFNKLDEKKYGTMKNRAVTV